MIGKRCVRRISVVLLALLIIGSFSGFWTGFIVYAADSLSITGTFTFAGGEPIRHAYVEAYDADIPGPFGTCPGPMDEYLGYSYTGEDGSYTIDKRDNGDPIDNDDGWLQDGRDIYVVCYARNWRVDVCGNPDWMSWLLFEGGPYRFRTTVHDDVSAGTVNMGSKDAPSDEDEAFNVFDTINRGYEAWLLYGLPHPPHVTAFWDDYFTPEASYYFPSGIARTGILPAEFDWWLRALIEAWRAGSGLTFAMVAWSLEGIHLRDGDGWREDVVLHEYGHFIMDKFADFWPPITVLQHTHTQNYNPQHAWGEGWAHFFSAVLRRWAGYPEYGPVGYRQEPFDIESHSYKGDSNEAAVAGVLWDIYDSENESGDTLSLGFAPMWDILRNYDPDPSRGWPNGKDHPWTIYDFWDGWYASWWWQWHGYRYSLWSIFVLHGMDVPPDNTPPSNPAEIRSSHFPYVWSGDNTVDVWWGPAADDISGAKDYLVIWDNSPATVPELNAAGATLVTDTDYGAVTSPPFAPGDNWWFHVRTRDYAGNWATGATHYGPLYIEAAISVSVIPTTIVSDYTGTIIGSTTLPSGSVITLKITYSTLAYDHYERVTDWEPWAMLAFWDYITLYATVDSQGTFTALVDTSEFLFWYGGSYSVIALWYDGSEFWHSSRVFDFQVEHPWFSLEDIPDTVYFGQAVTVMGSTNRPPGTIVELEYHWSAVFDLRTAVVDSSGNFVDVFKPDALGDWHVGIGSFMTHYWAEAYFQVVPLPPPKISITPSTATLQPTLGSSVTYTISIQNDGPTDTFFLSLIPPQASHLYWAGWARLNFQYQTGLTVPSGQTLTTTLTITPKGGPLILGDYEFKVSTSYCSWPRSTNTAQATLRVDFTPTLPAAPTGGLAIAVQPKTTYMSPGTQTVADILILNNQNFDDAITVEITNSGIPTQYQADLNWFNFPRWTARVYIPAGQSLKIPLLMGVPAGTPNGMYIFRAVATSTAKPTVTAKDAGIIRIQ